MISFMALDANSELIVSKMKPFTYPAGEVSIKFEDSREFEKTELAIIQSEFGSIHNDLMSYRLWDKALWKADHVVGYNNHLIMPYMPGAREDRGKVFGLEVYVDVITDAYMEGGHVVIFDPHSKVTEELFEGWGGRGFMKILSVADLVRQRRWAFEGYDYVIAPDEGATERAQSVADVLGVPVVQFKKKRDFDTGKILGIEPVEELDLGAKYLVVDDICDGGRTFTELSTVSGLLPREVDLYVSHGVFSKGTKELEKKFGRIITTNSYLSDSVLDGVLQKNGVEVLDVIRPMIDLIK